MNANEQYFEFLRLAFVAASQSAEDILSEIELSDDDYELVDGYIKIDGRCKLARFFKEYGERFESENGEKCFVIGNSFIMMSPFQNHTQLRTEYSYFQRPERPIIERALTAIHYVLVQIEPNIEIVINNQ